MADDRRSARLCVFHASGIASEHWLDTDRVHLVGRSAVCEIQIDHPSVTRRHARFEPQASVWALTDLESRNGTFVDGAPIDRHALDRDAWLRFGDVYAEWVLLDPQARQALDDSHARRRTRARLLTRQLSLSGQTDPAATALAAVLELGQCTRGCVLAFRESAMHVLARFGFGDSPESSFPGSHGALARALASAAPMIEQNLGDAPWLAARGSVAESGLQAVIVLPLAWDGRIQGAVYADRLTGGPAITALDRDLLLACADHVALWLAGFEPGPVGIDWPLPKGSA